MDLFAPEEARCWRGPTHHPPRGLWTRTVKGKVTLERLVVGLSSIHGNGLFSRRHIASGARLGRISGPILTCHDTLDAAEDSGLSTGGEYIMTLRRGSSWVVVEMGPPFKYANHSSDPNVRVRANGWVETLRDVNPCEELLSNYGCLHAAAAGASASSE